MPTWNRTEIEPFPLAETPSDILRRTFSPAAPAPRTERRSNGSAAPAAQWRVSRLHGAF
jgi:hypothetical protein